MDGERLRNCPLDIYSTLKPGTTDTETPAYANQRFWKSYVRLNWCDLRIIGLRQFAERVAKLLPPRRGEPIQVLALGFGVGALELPVLHHLEKAAGRQINITALDCQPQPLAAAALLLKDGLSSIPVGADDAAELLSGFGSWDIPRHKDMFPIGVGPHHLVLDNLDYESSRDVTGDGFLDCIPSQWANRLRRQSFFPKQGFHLVLTPFCLFHLDWWRRVLLDALAMLEPGGALLHAILNGDEVVFEGKEPDLSLAGIAGALGDPRIKAHFHAEGGRTALAEVLLLQNFFKDPGVEAFLRTPRDNSATRPFGIDEMLQRLRDTGEVDLMPEEGGEALFSYWMPVSFSANDYMSLLETRGFSTFRRIRQVIKADNYDKLLREVRKHARSANGLDRLLLQLKWLVLQKRAQQSEASLALRMRFGLMDAVKPSPQASVHMREYELALAASRQQLFENASDRAAHFAKHLATAGLLVEGCLGGEFGFWNEEDNKPEFFVFPNPLHKWPDGFVAKKFISGVGLYLGLLHTLRSCGQEFSNTRLLLRGFMPQSTKPCVFSYVREAERRTVSVSIHPYWQFNEIRFHLPEAAQESQMHLDLGALCLEKLPDPSEPGTETEPPSFAWSSKSNEVVGPLFSQSDFIQSADLGRMANSISSSAKAYAHVELRLAEKLKTLGDGATSPMLQTLEFLRHSPGWRSFVMFPATYFLQGCPHADQVVLLYYDRVLEPATLAQEYRKLDQMFGVLGLAHLAEDRSRQLAKEIRAGADYVRSLLAPPEHTGKVVIDWAFVPEHLGGDIFDFRWLGDFLVFYMLDACGHGVKAALFSVSVQNFIRSKWEKDDSGFQNPVTVLKELHAFVKPNSGVSACVWYGVWDDYNRTLHYASAGDTIALLRRNSTSAFQKLQTSENEPIGFGEKDQRIRLGTAKLPHSSEMLVFTDGVYQALSPRPRDAFRIFKRGLEAQSFTKPMDVYNWVRKEIGRSKLDDDFSLLFLTF